MQFVCQYLEFELRTGVSKTKAGRLLNKDDQYLFVFTEATEVGQNIATMSDLSSNFNIANFIEIWFMQSLDYRGSVTYYNE